MDFSMLLANIEVDLMNPWVGVAFVALVIVLGVVAKIVSKVSVSKVVQDKLGYDLPEAVDEMVDGFLVKGINWAENWAQAQADKPASDDKLAEAVRFALEKAGDNETLRTKIEDKGVELVEKLLRSNETVDAVTPKE